MEGGAGIETEKSGEQTTKEKINPHRACLGDLFPSARIYLLQFPFHPKSSFNRTAVNEPIQEGDSIVLVIQSCPKVPYKPCYIGEPSRQHTEFWGAI